MNKDYIGRSWQEIKVDMLSSKEAQEAYQKEERIWNLREKLIEAREQANLTQTELAKKMHLAPANLSRLEKTPEKANIQTLFKYFDACNVRLDFNLNKH